MATGLKTVRPDKIVYTYQGDGDLASIGMAEIVHAANRGQNITVIFINNAIYGMTGGQMAPTTLIGQKATTCPLGRDAKVNGYPLRVSEMLATLPAPGFITRVTVAQPKYTLKAKQAIKKAFQNQVEGKGFSLVEVLSSCPTNWGMRPVEAFDWLISSMMPYYPLASSRISTRKGGEQQCLPSIKHFSRRGSAARASWFSASSLPIPASRRDGT